MTYPVLETTLLEPQAELLGQLTMLEAVDPTHFYSLEKPSPVLQLHLQRELTFQELHLQILISLREVSQWPPGFEFLQTK
jgi:hypothetical protein